MSANFICRVLRNELRLENINKPVHSRKILLRFKYFKAIILSNRKLRIENDRILCKT